jgi:8-oxo-dGTP pyrophosphatase MutT (NUDIX family)
MSAPAVRPASTVLVLRATEGPPELYLVKRHGRSGFMAGAHVFPGGRVDDEDQTWSTVLSDEARAHAVGLVDGIDDDDVCIGYCVAAVRETAEECGLLLATDQTGATPSGTVAEAVFEALKGGASFHEQLRTRGLVPDLLGLSAFAWWVTPEAEPKRYDTRFFIAQAPADQMASIDAHEVTEGDWMRPDDAVRRYRAGEIRLAPPTLASLEDLAGANDLDTACSRAKRPLRPIMPVLHQLEEGMVLSLPGDPLHPEREAIWPEVRSRFVMTDDNRFVSVWAG